MAFVVVLHLPSSHPSNLSSILARTTSLDVVEVSDGERIQPNRVFVIPAGCCLALCGNQFRLTPRDKEVPPTPHVIDQFFHSLAEQCGPQSAGVILSGTGVDGTAGLSSIKAVGGITFAQDSSAVHGGMPGSAVATGVVDFVLPPEQIAARLILWSHHHRDGARNPFAKNEPHPEQVEKEEQADFQEILTLLTASSGIDFQNYKTATLRRRLERRAAICHVESLNAYRQYLNFNPDELEMLEQEALIHVTSFFRDQWELVRALQGFSLGGVDGTGPIHLALGAPLVLIGGIAAWCWSRPLDVLLSGEVEAAALGVDVTQVRRWVLIWTATLTAAAVALGGSAAFIGLIVPHVMRSCVGVGHRQLIPVSAIAGAAFLVGCDILARVLPPTGELPIGVVTGMIGAPLFIVVLIRSRRELV